MGRLVSPAHQIASDVGYRSAAGQRHHSSDVGSEEPECMFPALTADRKTVQVGPPGHAARAPNATAFTQCRCPGGRRRRR